jgi:hypothetical protein
MSVAAHPGVLSLAAQRGKDREMVVMADKNFPAIVAQNVGREICHGRQDVIRIVGDKQSLDRIAWIFQKVPDMFTIQFQQASLVVSSYEQRQAKRQNGVRNQSLWARFRMWVRRKLK